jgi:uncharacterized protein (UPF0276 family)
MKASLHTDGTISFWSVYSQNWKRAYGVSNADLAAMDEETRRKVVRHMVKHANRFGEG